MDFPAAAHNLFSLPCRKQEPRYGRTGPAPILPTKAEADQQKEGTIPATSPTDSSYLGKAASLSHLTLDLQSLVLTEPALPADLQGSLRAAYADVEDGVLDLSSALPAGTQDYEARKLFEFLVQLRRAVQYGAGSAEDAYLALVSMTDVLKRIERRNEHVRLDDPTEAAHFLLDRLSTLTSPQLASLAGVSERTIGAWRKGSPVRKGDRVVLVAQLVTYLQHSMSQRGILLWFNAPQDVLDGQTPLQALAEDVDQARARLVPLVRGGRGQLGV